MLSSTLPLAIALIGRRHKASLKAIYPFLWLSAVAGVYELIGTTYYGLNFRIWFKIYTILEFISLVYFFTAVAPKIATLLKWILGIFVLTAMATIWIWVYEGDDKTDSILCALETLVVYLGSIFWFRDLFSGSHVESLWQSPDFYFISGFVLYFSGTLFLFLMGDFVFSYDELVSNWSINIGLSLLLILTLSVGAWKTRAA
jgi:hypothetical protein